MTTNIHILFERRNSGELTYNNIADMLGVPEPYIYKLGAQQTRVQWSPAFEGLSPRVRNALCGADISTTQELHTLYDNLQLLTVPNFGMKSYTEVGHWLKQKGLL